MQGNPIIIGGNVDFAWNGIAGLLDFVPAADWATGDCEWSYRYGSIYAIHFNNDAFHLDAAGPQWGSGLGFLWHGIFNLGFGNINGRIPLVP